MKVAWLCHNVHLKVIPKKFTLKLCLYLQFTFMHTTEVQQSPGHSC